MYFKINRQFQARLCMHEGLACAPEHAARSLVRMCAHDLAPAPDYAPAYAPAYAPTRARAEEKKKRKSHQAAGVTIVSSKLCKPC